MTHASGLVRLFPIQDPVCCQVRDHFNTSRRYVWLLEHLMRLE
jgi:hypothetical protein